MFSCTSTKRRPKKKIRRILDDTELGEETKRKIAIEKVKVQAMCSVTASFSRHLLKHTYFQERQERLKSLGAKYSSETMFMNSGVCCKTSYESGSLEMLGDVETGYIVNVVREDGEEAVRIPPSISAKLKAHQVTFYAVVRLVCVKFLLSEVVYGFHIVTNMISEFF